MERKAQSRYPANISDLLIADWLTGKKRGYFPNNNLGKASFAHCFLLRVCTKQAVVLPALPLGKF
jgi:hypothetical protein